MKHSDIFKYAFFCTSALTATCFNSKGMTQDRRPNIIYIFTDQQSASMMSCTGNKWLKTPAMDYIANNGIRFTRAYTTNPVSAPARVSLMTGRFPGYFSDDKGIPVRENGGAMRIPEISKEVQRTTIAAFLKQAGYEIVYGGKEHLPRPLRPSTLGFNDISDDERYGLAEQVAKYIKIKRPKPYFMVVSLINPHDICYMALRDFAEAQEPETLDEALIRLRKRGTTELSTLDQALKIPEGISEEEFFREHCPPLPPNHEPQKGEPEAVKSILMNFRKYIRDNYDEEDWRMHRWAYCRLTELVDRQIQLILDAIKESGQEENTLILFSSDHGDMDAAHRMEHKGTLYEEATNTPFLAMWKGHIPGGRIDSTHLVSNGLDLLPTICDYAGTEGLADIRGKSLRKLFENEKTSWRKTLGVESGIGQMIVDDEGFKYIRYDVSGIEEQLLDMNKDPYETTHFTDSIGYAPKLSSMRKIFETEWFPSKK
jgi:choline-sulfatase